MSSVRVLVGTKKGAFILTSDGTRQKWKVEGPLFAGGEVYHLKGSPVDPSRIYCSQSSGWFGQVIQRSSDGGKTWETPGGGPQKSPQGWPMGESNKFGYDTSAETGQALTTHQWYDGTQHPWEFKRVWHLEPSLTDPDTCYAGVEDAALFKTTNGGATWSEFAGLRAAKGEKWSPGAGGLCLHTILVDPTNPNRMTIAISAAGCFRTDDGGKTWKPTNKGLRNDYLPDPRPEIGFCVHDIVRHPSRPNTLFMQLHQGGGAYRSDDAGDTWQEVKGNLPTDFGFPIRGARARAEHGLCGAAGPDAAHAHRRQIACVAQQDGWQRVGAAEQGAAARELLRECVARRDGSGFAGRLRDLRGHVGRAGLSGWRRHVADDCARPAARAVGGSADGGVKVPVA